MFIESFGNATLHNGLFRIECKIVGGDGKEQIAGHMIFPAQYAGRMVQQLEQILVEIRKMIDEAGARKPN